MKEHSLWYSSFTHQPHHSAPRKRKHPLRPEMPRGRRGARRENSHRAPARKLRPRRAGTVPDDSDDTWLPSIGRSRGQKHRRLNARSAIDSYPLVRLTIRSRETSPAICSSSTELDESISSLDPRVDVDALYESVRRRVAPSSYPDASVHSPVASPASSPHSSINRCMEVCEQVTQGDANENPGTLVNCPAPAPPSLSPSSIVRRMEVCEQGTQINANGKPNSSVHSPSASHHSSLLRSIACRMEACEQVTQGNANGKPDTPVHSPAAAPPSSGPTSIANGKPDNPVSNMSICNNLTEMVNMFHADDSGDPEVQSYSHSEVEVVSGYRVKPSSARILRAIINKHGDISKNYPLPGLELRSFLLQRVCDIVEALEDRNIRDVTLEQVKNQLGEVSGFREALMDVDWLIGRLEKICDAKRLVRELCGFKVMKGVLVREMGEIEKKMMELELRKSVVDDEIKKIRRFGLEAKPRLMCFEKKGSLLDGLL